MIKVLENTEGQKFVLIPHIIFKNKQNINWRSVENYLHRYVGRTVEVEETEDVIYIGTDFPDEYKGSKYTRQLKGARAKAKANAAQVIIEILRIATDKRFKDNKKGKHLRAAGLGWYYYTTRFALPIYKDDTIMTGYSIYSACLLVKYSVNGKKYLYDLVDIKKEASNPPRSDK